MNSTDTAGEQIDDQRKFLHDLQDREDIVETDFSRDGLQTIYLEFGDEAGFHKTLQERAQGLGYRIEHLCGAVYRLHQK